MALDVEGIQKALGMDGGLEDRSGQAVYFDGLAKANCAVSMVNIVLQGPRFSVPEFVEHATSVESSPTAGTHHDSDGNFSERVLFEFLARAEVQVAPFHLDEMAGKFNIVDAPVHHEFFAVVIHDPVKSHWHALRHFSGGWIGLDSLGYLHWLDFPVLEFLVSGSEDGKQVFMLRSDSLAGSGFTGWTTVGLLEHQGFATMESGSSTARPWLWQRSSR